MDGNRQMFVYCFLVLGLILVGFLFYIFWKKIAGWKDFVPLSESVYTKIAPDELEFEEEIGAGAFGKIYKASLNGIERRKFVAVKTGKSSEIEREIEILKEIEHEHIVRYETACEIGGKVLLVMEYCEGDDLATRLRTFPPSVSDVERTLFAQDIASGMTYLASKNIGIRVTIDQN